MNRLRNYLLATIATTLLMSLPSAASAQGSPDFTKDIAPIFNKYCTGCHNDSDREGKLSLASHDALLKGGAKGSVVTPGQADVSRLLRLITGEAKPKMPPDDEEGPTKAEIDLLTAWVNAGAKGPGGAVPDPTKLVTPQVKLLAEPRLAINAIALSPAGDVLALARHGEVELQSLPARKTLHKLSGIRGSVNGIAFSRDGKLIAAAAGEAGLFGEARVWNTADGSLVKTFVGHKDSLYCVAISPDAKVLATGGYDNQIKLWSLGDGKELRTLDGHNGAVFEVAFRPDGQVLASASGDRTVKLWDVATGERLDTLKESLKELYSLAFSPDGSRVAAAGVDNRIRVWQVTPEAKEGTNSLLHSVFAHELSVLRLAWSADGQTIASAGEDRLVKVWNAGSMTIRQLMEPQTDWASGLAIGPRSERLIVGRIDGTVGLYDIAQASGEQKPLVPLAEVPPEVDYGLQPPIENLQKTAETEPNDQPETAALIGTPGTATGKILGTDPPSAPSARDVDLYRFAAAAGDQWIIETNAARSGSPLDTKVEVLDAAGQPVPRLLLRAVRDTAIEFRGMNAEQRGVRLANWEEMLLNEYVYLGGEVIKHFQQRRGPDADAQFYPENGNRFAFFDTSSRAHALGEPGYIVVPYAVGTELPNNGLPVFTVNFENDDDAQRKLGKDSRLTFVAPADGTYFIRVSDVRGFSGEDFKYELTIQRPQPDFKVTLTGAKPTVNASSGKTFTVKAERTDNFMGPIRVDISGLPPGFQATTPLEIAAGLYEAQGVLNALPSAAAPTEEQLKAIKITATATVCGQERTKDVDGFGTIKLGDKQKVTAFLESADAGAPREVTLAPGGSVMCKLRVERNGFDDRIAFDIGNLPHGVIVDDIGLSGVLVREKELERTIFLRAEPWVPEQSRLFHATAQVDGNQVSLPIRLHVRRK